jgi:menaquinone-dependent protoporphyrinogen IX oxidase
MLRVALEGEREQVMKALVVYESMYGNTHAIADAIADGLGDRGSVRVLPVDRVEDQDLDGLDLLVVGGPTHVHGMSRASTRKAAMEAAAKPDAGLEVDADAEGPGLRGWFDRLTASLHHAAAFDTRMKGPSVFTGRAANAIARRLRAHGATLVVEPESFLVTKTNDLLPDEESHARAWGASLAAAVAGLGTGSATSTAGDG